MSNSLWSHGLQHNRLLCPSLPEIAQTQVHWLGDAIQPSHPLSSPSPPPLIFPSIRLFSNKLALCIRWPKYWSVSFSISPSKEYSRLISFSIDWLDLLAVQGTLKSLLQHHNLKASILQCSASFKVCHIHVYTHIYAHNLYICYISLVLEKAEEPEIKLPTSAASWKKQDRSRKTSISALLTMPRPLTVWITINCGKFWKRWEYQAT